MSRCKWAGCSTSTSDLHPSNIGIDGRLLARVGNAVVPRRNRLGGGVRARQSPRLVGHAQGPDSGVERCDVRAPTGAAVDVVSLCFRW